MKKIISLLIILITIIACGTIKPIPVETIYNYRDSVIVHVDSIAVDVPVERYVDLVNYTDTLVLETSVAKATAYADTTTRTLKGQIENKPVQLKKEIVYQDRIIEKEVMKDVPYPVEVEKIKYRHTFWDQLSWLISGLFISILIIYIIRIYVTKRKLL